MIRYDLREVKDEELRTEQWIGREWNLGRVILKLLAPNYHIQLYFELEEEPAGNNG